MTLDSIVQAGPGETAHNEPYRGFPDLPHFPLGDNLELVYCPLTGAARTVHAVALRLLQGCRGLAPLEEHVRRLCGELSIPPEQTGRVREQLTALASTGLLVSHRQLCDRLRQVPSADPVPITTIGIPTRDRLASLERGLESIVIGLGRDRPPPDLVIVDDSAREGQQTATRSMLQALRKRYTGPVFHAGPDAKDRYARRLAEFAGLDPETVAFALVNIEKCPIATGGSRNLLLLHAVGEALLQLDDDIVWRLAPVPEARPGLVCTSQHDPTEFWFPADGQSIPPLMPHDLLTIHEQLLGKGLSDCLGTLPAGIEPDFDRTGANFFRRGGQVRITAAGVAGDSGMSLSLYFLLLEDPSRARLLHSEAIYRGALAHQALLRGVTRPTVSPGAVCLAMNLGLDNRRLLPPFMPVQRNQDGIFAALVKTCCEGTFFGFLPWLLLHQPPQPRHFSPDDLVNQVASIRSDHILQLLIRLTAPRGRGTDEQNLIAVGNALADLADLPAREFAEVVRLQVWEQLSGLSCQLSGLVQKYGGQPAWWAADIQRLLTGLRGGLTEANALLPDDLRLAFGPETALGVLQRLVARFGRLLRCWPVMVEAARDLRARGVRPAEPI